MWIGRRFCGAQQVAGNFSLALPFTNVIIRLLRFAKDGWRRTEEGSSGSAHVLAASEALSWFKTQVSGV